MVTLASLPGSVTMPYTKTDRLVAAIKRRIAGGEFEPGDRIPSGAKLAEEYDVSMVVVTRAMGILEAEGVIVSVQGAGRFVAVREPEQ